MIHRLVAALMLTAFSLSAFAGSCPRLMSEIDAALADADITQTMSDEQLAEARELRQKGEEAHRAGDHGESEKTLRQAKEVLGIS